MPADSDPMSSTKSSPVETPPLLEWPRESGKVDLVLRNMEAKLKKRRQRRVRTAAGIASCLLLVASTLWTISFVRFTDTVETAAANRQTLALADGSQAELNARTNIHTDFRFGRRTVRLTQGEAFFSVAKDAAHPFLVQTPAGTIRVTGTAFNVRLTPEGPVVVTLVEGAVTVRQAGTAAGTPDVALRPSEQLWFDSSATRTRVMGAREVEQELAWRSGRLVLEGLTLADAAARFAAYHGRQITVSPEVASLLLGGSCPLDELTGFLDFAKESLRVQVHARGDRAYFLTTR